MVPLVEVDLSDPRRVVETFIAGEFNGVLNLRHRMTRNEPGDSLQKPDANGMALLTPGWRCPAPMAESLPSDQPLDVTRDPWFAVTRYHVQRVLVMGEKAIAEVDFARRAEAYRQNGQRKLLHKSVEHDQITLMLARQEGRWLILSPPAPRIAIEQLLYRYRSIATEENLAPMALNPWSATYQHQADLHALAFIARNVPATLQPITTQLFADDDPWLVTSRDLVARRQRDEATWQAWSTSHGEGSRLETATCAKPAVEAQESATSAGASAEGTVHANDTKLAAAARGATGAESEINDTTNLRMVASPDLPPPRPPGGMTPCGKRPGVWCDDRSGISFIFIPGGTYWMGCEPWMGACFEDEMPLHRVTLDGFWLATRPVTQAEWRVVMGTNPSITKSERNPPPRHFDPRGDDPWRQSIEVNPELFEDLSNHPVENIGGNQAWAFIRRLNAASGQAFRLPTEAEWEYVCRFGHETYRPLPEIAWKSRSARLWKKDPVMHKSFPVGKTPPNLFGVHDMLGNIFEWVQDLYDPTGYARHGERNPVVAGRGQNVVRGGYMPHVNNTIRPCWYRSPEVVRVPVVGEPLVGFRLALSQ
ncbi:MAG: SUMF1/EgtB/PvdO family nonheme iron enzyme [Magnetococcales bacterium]|nr:SUMF1/EgtB/PvdO family nonheme iron enzyme [Magnetococcales bacterium]